MKKLNVLLKNLLIREEAATAVEYAMIVGLIALVAFIAFQKLGFEVKRIINLMTMYLRMYVQPQNNP